MRITLTATVGMPASGKTMWTMKQIKLLPVGMLGRSNRDKLREMLHGKWLGSSAQENMVTLAQNAIVNTYLLAGIPVIADDTNMFGMESVARWQSIANQAGAKLQIADFLNVRVEECQRRNALREGIERVPDHVIPNMWNGFRESMGASPDMSDDAVVKLFRTKVMHSDARLIVMA